MTGFWHEFIGNKTGRKGTGTNSEQQQEEEEEEEEEEEKKKETCKTAAELAVNNKLSPLLYLYEVSRIKVLNFLETMQQ